MKHLSSACFNLLTTSSPAPSHQSQALARMTRELSELKEAQRRAKAEMAQAGVAPEIF